TSAGGCVCWITCAMVKVLPEPVTPSSTWSRSWPCKPFTSAAMAAGWSPAGLKSETRVSGILLVVAEEAALLVDADNRRAKDYNDQCGHDAENQRDGDQYGNTRRTVFRIEQARNTLVFRKDAQRVEQAGTEFLRLDQRRHQ